MEIRQKIQSTLYEGEILDICIGLNWTAVVVDVNGESRCGLASTLHSVHDHSGKPDLPSAGKLVGRMSSELVAWIEYVNTPRVSLAMAAINATLPRQPEAWVERNAEKVIASLGQGEKVAMIGHFPFVPRLRNRLKNLFVIDRNPLEGDYPADAAPDILPDADFVAITGMTLLNGTLESLLELCSPQATVMLLGPSTPLSLVLFDYGVDLIAGSVVVEIEPVMRAVAQGASFRQVHRAGVRLVTQTRPGWR